MLHLQASHWKPGGRYACACRGTAGFAHVSCLVEEVKILTAEAEENNLDGDRWAEVERWYSCSLPSKRTTASWRVPWLGVLEDVRGAA